MQKRSKDILFTLVSGVLCLIIGFYTINFTSNFSKIEKLEKELLKYESTKSYLTLNYIRKIDFYKNKMINPFYSGNPLEN